MLRHHKHPNKKTLTAGLSIMELLIALALAGLMLSVMFQFFMGATKSSQKIANNTILITEAQLAQQFVGSRLIEAAYIFPTNYTFQFGNTPITKNYADDSYTFRVGTDSVIGGLVSPAQGEINHIFFAYYTMPRSDYIAATVGGVTLDPDPVNDDNTWVLLEYRKEFELPATGVAGILASDISGGQAYLLADYIEPAQGNPTPELNYNMFTFDSATQSIQFNLRMLHYTKSSMTCATAVRHPVVNCISDAVSLPVSTPFSQEIIPRNFFIGSDFN